MRPNLDELRQEIDKIDRELLAAFEKRIAVSRQIGNYKKSIGKDILDTSREADKLNKLEEDAGFESRTYVKRLYEEVFAISREHQLKPSFGVLGRSLPHTYSPEIHAILTSDYSYSIIEREPEELDELFASGVYKGFNVTIPYKIEAYKRCDVLDDAAKEIGSVNTVVFGDDGKTYGYNTDYYGFMYMLKQNNIDPKGKKVLVLGTGGAAVAINFALKVMEAADVKNCDLETEINYSNVYERASDANIIVNCTPVGMFPKVDNALLDFDKFPGLEACCDVVYNPSRTKFLQNAEAKGLKTAGGLSMLVAQAYKSKCYFVGDLEAAEKIDEAAEASIEKVFKSLQTDMRNITIIGMPGCGKSTLAKTLAQRLDRELIDLDQAYTEKYGETPAQTIEQQGEEVFRLQETEVAKEYLPKSGLIISCGGGIVTQPRNYFYLKCNSNVIYLDRPLSVLASEDRPLSARHGVEKLYSERKDKYEMLADYKISFDLFDSKQEFMEASVAALKAEGLNI